MPQDTKFDFDLAGIADTLSNSLLKVPIYQRSYSWGSRDAKERDQVAEFWNDLKSHFPTGEEYFLGTVVLAQPPGDDRASIIDGQQRLATAAILLAVIRDTFREKGEDFRADSIQTRLAHPDLATAQYVPRLILNADDDVFFRQFVINGDHLAVPTTKSHELMQEAYNQLYTAIQTSVDDAGVAWIDRLTGWIDYLSSKVRVITVTVPSEADAFLIFETLNDRGADLTIADLLKNYLFSKAGNQLEPVRNAWVTALGNLDIASQGSQLFTDFLRHDWSSRHGATRERELYQRIKDHVATAPAAATYASQMQDASRLYSAILNGDHEFWTGYGTEVKTNLRILKLLDLEQSRPLLLAMVQHLTPQQLKLALRGMVSWSVRSIIVGGIGGGSTERLYCETAMKVRSGTLQTATQIATELAPIVHSDAEFQDEFAVARVIRGRLARYLLAALERTKANTPEPELVPNEDEEQVNLEHVLPKNPTPTDWPQFTADERLGYLHRIGNLALLAKGPNGKIGNASFATKQPILAASTLELTKEAGANQDWSPAVIDARQAALAALAVKTWPS